MIEQAMQQSGSDWRFLTFEVGPEAFGDAMRGVRALGLRGVKIIDPHREAVLDFVDDRTDHARLARSANCITLENERLIAENTLGKACVALLDSAKDKRILVLGAGKTGRAIASAAALAGAAAVTVVSRSVDKGTELASVISQETKVPAESAPWPNDKLTIPVDVDVLANATSIGSVDPDQSLPIDADSLRAELTVADVTFNSPSTWFLRAAADHGCHTIDGLSILVEQTALALRQWTNIEADRNAMREAAEEFLAI